MKKINAVPVALGRDYPITIHDLGSHGEGVGRYEGFTVFVAGALPGETVRATILSRGTMPRSCVGNALVSRIY